MTGFVMLMLILMVLIIYDNSNGNGNSNGNDNDNGFTIFFTRVKCLIVNYPLVYTIQSLYTNPADARQLYTVK